MEKVCNYVVPRLKIRLTSIPMRYISAGHQTSSNSHDDSKGYLLIIGPTQHQLLQCSFHANTVLCFMNSPITNTPCFLVGVLLPPFGILLMLEL